MEGWFSAPVEVAVGITGDVRYVSSARQATQLLTANWPTPGTPGHRAAHRACLAIINGDSKDIDRARAAFEEAAREARILVE